MLRTPQRYCIDGFDIDDLPLWRWWRTGNAARESVFQLLSKLGVDLVD